jgi:hypothetical protein
MEEKIVKNTQINKNKKKLKDAETEKFKQKYFEYYDDIKSHTHKVTDW